MENVTYSRPKRSLLRRVLRKIAAPVTSLALLAGGGWGAYQFYDPDQVGEVHAIVAHSATSTNEELKLLFASEKKSTLLATTPTVVPKAIEVKPVPKPVLKKSLARVDRYASTLAKPRKLSVAPPELPPLVNDKLLQDHASIVQTAAQGGRYGNALAANTEPSEPETEDVARGQEPNANSLRAAASSDLNARAAFGAALTPQRNLNAALEQARPLQSPTLANSRYRPGQPLPPQTRSQQPAPPLNIPTPVQRPMPALGAPPINMQTRQAPATPPQVASRNKAPQGLTSTPGLANHPGTGRPGESLLEGAQSPSITIQKLAPEQIQVGKRCTFAIRIQNSGQRTAQNVQIRDEVPLGTELVGTAPRATVSGSQIVWDMGTLSPGEERTVEMELLPKEEGELGSVARVTLSAQASAKSRCTRPELALRLTSKPQVHVGEQHVVQIEISNPGSGDATGVMLLETIPTGVSHEAGPALEFEVGTLKPGENRRMELLLTAEQAGQINNVMTARADASLQVEASCEFEVIAPKLQLSVAGPQRRYLERPATYRLSVDNPGTASAKDIQLVTHLPQGMQFVSANNMGEYDSSSHSVHWSLAELPASERGTVELVALPIESGTQTLQVSTKARHGLEDRTDKQVQVEGLSALMFEVVDIEGLIEIGGETTYEIRVQNQGSKAASNVQVIAVMPAGIRPTSGQGETRHSIQGERVIFAPLPQLAPKAETTFRIQAQGIRPGDQRVRIQISSDDLQQPITKEVSTRVYADE